VNIALEHDLTFVIERKIALAIDACSRPPITIRSHDLHACNNRGAMGEIISYHKRDKLFPFFGCVSLGLFAFFPFVLCVMVMVINF
jgi:hypothetical protein